MNQHIRFLLKNKNEINLKLFYDLYRLYPEHEEVYVSYDIEMVKNKEVIRHYIDLVL